PRVHGATSRQKAIAIAACVRVLGTPLFQKWCVAKDRPQADCSRQGADVIEDAFVASSNLAPAIACFHSSPAGLPQAINHYRGDASLRRNCSMAKRTDVGHGS